MDESINWNASLSTAGTVMSTAANIFNAINNGKIKAIQMEAEANHRASQNRIDNMETNTKLQELDTQYQEQLTAISEKYSQSTENQQVSGMMQGRTLDSLSSIESTDDRAVLEDKELSLLNKQSTESALKTDRDIRSIQSKVEESDYHSAGKLAKTKSYADVGSTLVDGTKTLLKNNAFDPKYYKKR